MSADHESDELAALRAELDDVDGRLQAAVRDRIDVVLRIGDYKRRNGVAMMQPHRVRAVHDRAAAFAAAHGLDEGFLRGLYDAIIAESCRLEDQVIAEAGDGAGP